MSDTAFGFGRLDVNYIDGQLAPAASGFDNINPATEEVIGQGADGTAADMDRAIDAARRAFDTSTWRADHEFRAHCLDQLHDALVEAGPRMRDLTTAEVGAPAFLTAGPQYDTPVGTIKYCADLARTYGNWKEDLGNSTLFGIESQRWIVREGAGVVGAIAPWNFPHQIHFAKVGPALAAGCTVVLKPAPDTPWCGSALAALIAEKTDIPAGVFNVVNSSDHSLGAQLAGDPRVDVVSFTGSTATGRKVMQSAADNITKVFLELGGKSAFIILDDADMAAAASLAAFSVATHAGQGCALTTRLLVPKAHAAEVVDIAASTMQALAAGDPTDPGTVCGPLISARQRERVEGYLQLATDEGGTFACGGGRSPGRERGFFIDPTVVVGLDNSARVAREEIFGPVLTVIEYDGDDQAVDIANDSPYGLSGAVYSGDEERAWDIASRVRTGTMGINGGVWFASDAPFGGYKQSGIGREMGVLGFEEYLESKTVAVSR